MLRQPRFRASIATPAQKSRGLRVVYSKNFSMATFFCVSIGRYVFEQFAHETNLKKKRCVTLCNLTRIAIANKELFIGLHLTRQCRPAALLRINRHAKNIQPCGPAGLPVEPARVSPTFQNGLKPYRYHQMHFSGISDANQKPIE